MEYSYFLLYIIFIYIIVISLCIICESRINHIDNFNVGSRAAPADECPKLDHGLSVSDYTQMVSCYNSSEPCVWNKSLVNLCIPEYNPSCNNVNNLYGWDKLSSGQRADLCTNVYSKHRNFNCILENDICKSPVLSLSSRSNYLNNLNNLLNIFKGDRKTKVLLENEARYKISGLDYNNLNDHSDIIDFYTTDELFLQTTPNIEYLENNMSILNKSNLLDVIYYAKENKKLYDWSTPIELGDVRYDGSTLVLFDMYQLISSAKKTITITTLGNDSRSSDSDYMLGTTFLTIIKNGIISALQNVNNDIDIRIIVGGPLEYIKGYQLNNTLDFLTSNNAINQRCNIILINHNSNTKDFFGKYNGIWNHSKIIMVDGSSIRIGGQNMYDDVYLSRDYYNDQGGPILDTNLLFFTNQTLHIINFCNQLCYQSLNRISVIDDTPIISLVSDRQRSPGALPSSIAKDLTIQKINNFSNREIKAGSITDINNTIFSNNPINFKGMFIFKYNNTYDDLSSIDADEHSRILAFRNIATETIYLSQQRLHDPLDFMSSMRHQFESLSIALNKGITVKCVLSRDDYDNGYSSTLSLIPLKLKFVRNGCDIKNLSKGFKLKYVSYISNNRNILSAQHTKMWCVDEQLLSIGSHNFYGSPLQQSSIVLDDTNLINKYLNNDFHSKWNYSINPAEINYVVYIIRHGEKDRAPSDTCHKNVVDAALGMCPLNARGRRRGRNLRNLFKIEPTYANLNNFELNDYDPVNNPYESNYIKPGALYAHKYPSYDSERCLQLLQEDLAGHLDLSINHDYGYSDPIGLGNLYAANSIFETMENTDTNCILVVWEHANINSLANNLMGLLQDDLLIDWSDSDFDTIYELYYNTPDMHGLVDFRVSTQNFN